MQECSLSYTESSFLYDRYKNVGALLGDELVNEPSILHFINSDLAIEILTRAIMNNKLIILHCDVDMDGISTTKIVYKFIRTLSPYIEIKLCINKKKVHGLNEESHPKYFNSFDNALVIILDSGCNDIPIIKKINHDVLVIDHHEVSVPIEDLSGNTNCGQYCVVTNNVDNPIGNYKACNNMSAGLVSMEFFRYMQVRCNLSDIVNDLRLYTWAVVSLFTDVINNDELRNIYYIDKVFSSNELESGLSVMSNLLKMYRGFDKSFICYTLAPTFNRAIRAQKCSEAVKIAVERPEDVINLLPLKLFEAELLFNYLADVKECEHHTSRNITGKLDRNYSGLIATKLQDHFRKSSICYITNFGMAEGSFRGKYNDIDYRKIIHDTGNFAQGHDGAFGFKVPVSNLENVLSLIDIEEETREHKEYLSAGDKLPIKDRGIYHIPESDGSLQSFKRSGLAWKIGILNSKISSSSQCINIVVSRDEVELIEEFTKRSVYSCLGYKCNVYEPLVSDKLYLYLEYSGELIVNLSNKFS